MRTVFCKDRVVNIRPAMLRCSSALINVEEIPCNLRFSVHIQRREWMFKVKSLSSFVRRLHRQLDTRGRRNQDERYRFSEYLFLQFLSATSGWSLNLPRLKVFRGKISELHKMEIKKKHNRNACFLSSSFRQIHIRWSNRHDEIILRHCVRWSGGKGKLEIKLCEKRGKFYENISSCGLDSQNVFDKI